MQRKLFCFSEDGGSREDWNPFYIPFVLVTGDDFSDPIFERSIRRADDAVDKWVAAVKAKFPTYIVDMLPEADGIEIEF